MKKITTIFFILILLLAQNISGQELGDLFTERTGGFTMSMPLGWQTADVGLRLLGIMGPQDGAFIPNFTFAEEEYSGSVASYLDLLLDYFPILFSEYRLLDRSSFRTNAGENGECITYLLTMGQIQVRQRAYVIPNRSRTVIMFITGTAPVAGGERYDGIFDASVRTFNWTR
jgi:hypothetical protein